jgi:hypothetical protein
MDTRPLKGARPTPRQREILEQLVNGRFIDSVYRHPKFLHGPYINFATWRAMKRRQWVTARGITALGRKALEETMTDQSYTPDQDDEAADLALERSKIEERLQAKQDRYGRSWKEMTTQGLMHRLGEEVQAMANDLGFSFAWSLAPVEAPVMDRDRHNTNAVDVAAFAMFIAHAAGTLMNDVQHTEYSLPWDSQVDDPDRDHGNLENERGSGY